MTQYQNTFSFGNGIPKQHLVRINLVCVHPLYTGSCHLWAGNAGQIKAYSSVGKCSNVTCYSSVGKRSNLTCHVAAYSLLKSMPIIDAGLMCLLLCVHWAHKHLWQCMFYIRLASISAISNSQFHCVFPQSYGIFFV